MGKMESRWSRLLVDFWSTFGPRCSARQCFTSSIFGFWSLCFSPQLRCSPNAQKLQKPQKHTQMIQKTLRKSPKVAWTWICCITSYPLHAETRGRLGCFCCSFLSILLLPKFSMALSLFLSTKSLLPRPSPFLLHPTPFNRSALHCILQCNLHLQRTVSHTTWASWANNRRTPRCPRTACDIDPMTRLFSWLLEISPLIQTAPLGIWGLAGMAILESYHIRLGNSENMRTPFPALTAVEQHIPIGSPEPPAVPSSSTMTIPGSRQVHRFHSFQDSTCHGASAFLVSSLVSDGSSWTMATLAQWCRRTDSN